MDNRLTLQDHRRPQLPNSSSSSGSRLSSSQSYFDVYPERRGNRPYTPSQRLTSSSLKSLPNSEDDQQPNDSITRRQRSPLKPCNRQELLRDDLLAPSTSNSWLTVSSRSADLTPSSSSSSVQSAHADNECKVERAMPTASTPQREVISQKPTTSSRKYQKPHLIHMSASEMNQSSHGKLQMERHHKPCESSTPFRLKSQKSMPNVKARKYQQPEVPSYSWLGSAGKKNAARVLHKDASEGQSSLLKTAKRLEDEDDHSDSDSSLDSVGKEVRRTLNLSMHAAQRKVRRAQTSNLIRSTDDSLMRKTLRQGKKFDILDCTEKEESWSYLASEFRTPSPSVQSVKTMDTPERRIQRYVRSKRLNTLLTLSQAPYRGRVISLADVGDADGHAVFVFLGIGAVRYLAGLYDEMASVLGLRIICIDRWGQGKTDKIPADQRGVLEWSGVVTEVADRFGIANFSVLAHSAGAPYAMATALMQSNRIAGPVHLLAPWVSPTMESSYRWLKYVPDGVIKTAQAADSRMQAWKFGFGRSRIDLNLNQSDSEDASSLMDEEDHSEPPVLDSSRHFSNLPSMSALPPLYRAFSQVSLQIEKEERVRQSEEESQLASSVASNSSRPSIPSKDSRHFHSGMSSSATTPCHLDTSQDSADSPTLRKTLLSVEKGTRRLPARLPLHRTSSNYHAGRDAIRDTRMISPTEVNAAPDLATALLKASHAENAASGGSNDLLVILGRSSQKPWGFNYIDVTHPVAVWYGDKDERISMTSIQWMKRELHDCSVKIVKGATHNLMTNAGVVVEALESIATHRSERH